MGKGKGTGDACLAGWSPRHVDITHGGCPEISRVTGSCAGDSSGLWGGTTSGEVTIICAQTRDQSRRCRNYMPVPSVSGFAKILSGSVSLLVLWE